MAAVQSFPDLQPVLVDSLCCAVMRCFARAQWPAAAVIVAQAGLVNGEITRI